MKLDATDLRYITSDEFRVLTAVGKLVMRCEGVDSDRRIVSTGRDGLEEPRDRPDGAHREDIRAA